MIKEIAIHGKMASITYQYYTENSSGPWYVASSINSDYWYIINVNTKRVRKIGKVSLTGTNYYEIAVKKMKELNAKEEK